VLAVVAAVVLLYPRLSASPQDAVKGYLQALADGDAAKALGYAATPPADRTYLTDDVLSAIQAKSPLTNIVVKPAAGCRKGETCQVAATFDLGGEAVSATFAVTDVDGQYRLVKATRAVDLAALTNVQLTIEGRPAPGPVVELFPGVYRIESANPWLSADATNFTVRSPDDTAAPTVPVFALTPDAAPKLQAAAAAALDRCMGEKALFTTCGFGWAGLAGGATPDPAKLKWKYHAGASNTVGQAEFKLAEGATATAPISIMIDIDAYDTAGVHYVDSMTLTQASVDFADTEAPVVTMTAVT